MAFPRREPSIATTIRLPQSVYYEARTLLADPRTGRIKIDTWGPLIARLLRQWCDEQKIARVTKDDAA